MIERASPSAGGTQRFTGKHPAHDNSSAIISNFFRRASLQCFDAVGWAAGRASGL